MEATQNSQGLVTTSKYTSARKYSPFKGKSDSQQNRKLSADRHVDEEEK